MSDPWEGMERSTRVNIPVYNEHENPRQVSIPVFVHNMSNFADVFAFQSSKGKVTDKFQIAPTVLIPVQNGRTSIRALLDTGSSSSFISRATLGSVSYQVLHSKVLLNIRTLHGETKEPSQRVQIRLPGGDGQRNSLSG